MIQIGFSELEYRQAREDDRHYDRKKSLTRTSL
jgi:hypothetical protein